MWKTENNLPANTDLLDSSEKEVKVKQNVRMFIINTICFNL